MFDSDLSSAEPLLLDVPGLGAILGLTVHQARRFIDAPPPGFPGALRVRNRIYFRRLQVLAWARGEEAAPAHVSAALVAKRPRGRPRKGEGERRA